MFKMIDWINDNVKKIVIGLVVVGILAMVTIGGYFVYTDRLLYKLNILKITPLPQISTNILPTGKVGTPYKAEVFASITTINSALKISATDIPNGLSLGDCSSTSNSPLLPSPNTVTKCAITGTPTKEGVYKIMITVEGKNKDGFNIVSQNVELFVSP